MKFAFKVHDEKYIILELVEPTPVEGPPADKPADICPTGEYGLVSHQIKRKLGKYLIRWILMSYLKDLSSNLKSYELINIFVDCQYNDLWH